VLGTAIDTVLPHQAGGLDEEGRITRSSTSWLHYVRTDAMLKADVMCSLSPGWLAFKGVHNLRLPEIEAASIFPIRLADKLKFSQRTHVGMTFYAANLAPGRGPVRGRCAKDISRTTVMTG
jgi:hypothetical protein